MKTGGGIPFEMEAMVHGVTKRLESGLLPIYDAQDFIRKAVAAQGRVAEISGQRRTHFCGAYWGWGFHEDGVVSALRVGRELGAGSL